MKAAELAQTIALALDGEFFESGAVFINASADGESVVIRTDPGEGDEEQTERPRRFRAVLVEIEEGDDVSDFGAGRAHMLREVLADAETFEGLMKRRRYFNNANGVRRFVEYLRQRYGQETS